MTEKKVRIKIESTIYDLGVARLYYALFAARAEPEDAAEQVCYYTDGSLTEDGEKVVLAYEECAELGMSDTQTKLIFTKNEPCEISMVRTGMNSAGMPFSKKNARQNCSYNAAGLMMNFVIYTRIVENKLLSEEGTLLIDYVIEFERKKRERCCFKITMSDREGI